MAITDTYCKSFAFPICKSNALGERVLSKPLARRKKNRDQNLIDNSQRKREEIFKKINIESDMKLDKSDPVTKVKKISGNKLVLSSSN